jgi:hypothetical protein
MTEETKPIQLPTCEKCGSTEWERREYHSGTTFFYRPLADPRTPGGLIWQSSDLDAPHVETTFVCLKCDNELDGATEAGQDAWTHMYDILCAD